MAPGPGSFGDQEARLNNVTDHQGARLQDNRPDVKIVISGLWVQGRVPGGPVIDQTFLVAATAYVVVPSLMIVVSLLAPARVNRAANATVSLLYATSVAALAVNETWVYYLLGSLIELVLLLTITRISWAWPRSRSEHELTPARRDPVP